MKHRTSIDNGDKYLLCEPDLAYRASFDAEKGALANCGAVILSKNVWVQILALVRPGSHQGCYKRRFIRISIDMLFNDDL